MNQETRSKIEKIIDDLREREDFPVFYGQWELNKILKHLSDGESVYRRIIEKLSSPIEELIKDANRQIRDTRTIFNLSSSGGLVIIINKKVEILDAALIRWRIGQCFRKKKADGTYCFGEIDTVLLIDEAHHLITDGVDNGPIIVVYEKKSMNSMFVSDYAEYISFQYATWKGASVVNFSPAVLKRERLQSLERSNEAQSDQNRKLKRHEWWAECYRCAPYLRNLTTDQFIQYGQMLFARIAPFFLKGGKKASSSQIQHKMEQFTHFIEEVNFRGMDIRSFKLSEIDLSQWLQR